MKKHTKNTKFFATALSALAFLFLVNSCTKDDVAAPKDATGSAGKVTLRSVDNPTPDFHETFDGNLTTLQSHGWSVDTSFPNIGTFTPMTGYLICNTNGATYPNGNHTRGRAEIYRNIYDHYTCNLNSNEERTVTVQGTYHLPGTNTRGDANEGGVIFQTIGADVQNITKDATIWAPFVFVSCTPDDGIQIDVHTYFNRHPENPANKAWVLVSNIYTIPWTNYSKQQGTSFSIKLTIRFSREFSSDYSKSSVHYQLWNCNFPSNCPLTGDYPFDYFNSYNYLHRDAAQGIVYPPTTTYPCKLAQNSPGNGPRLVVKTGIYSDFPSRNDVQDFWVTTRP